MADIYYIGGKLLDLDRVNIKYYAKDKRLIIGLDKSDIKLDSYGNITFNFSSEFNLNKDEISFIQGDNLYIYNLDNIGREDYVYSINDLIFLGYNIKENKKFKLKENINYLISPSSKIKLGGGKIETDFNKILIKDEKIIRNILLSSFGIIIRVNFI